MEKQQPDEPHAPTQPLNQELAFFSDLTAMTFRPIDVNPLVIEVVEVTPITVQKLGLPPNGGTSAAA